MTAPSTTTTKPRVLVTGAAGFLGSNFCLAHAARFSIVAGTHRIAPRVPGIETVPMDLADPGSVERAWRQARPDAAIHLGAISRIDECEGNPLAPIVNVEAARRLASLAAAAGARFVHASTDLVFDGRSAPYHESDPPSPISDYGRTKAAAEAAVLEACPGALVVRISLAYGPAPGGGIRQIDWILAAARAGKKVPLFVDEFRTPMDSLTIADALAELTLRDTKGILHLGGPERWSRHDFGRLLLRWAGLDPDLAAPARIADLPGPRPADVSLDSSRAARELATPLLGVAAGLERVQRSARLP